MSGSTKINYIVEAGGTFNGEITVPGDKSISHRSIMLGSLANGKSEIEGFLEGEDSLATLRAFSEMGVEITGPENGKLTIEGVGMHGLEEPASPLDLGNSGTSMRLMSGLLSGQGFKTILVGDESLSGRPMRRVTDPLVSMGASIDTNDGTAPLKINANTQLHGIEYDMPIASAQVKSCLLLAGMYASGKTCVTEPGVTRDHTERMLQAFGYPVEVDGNRVCIEGGHQLTACNIQIPADISSAAFFLVGASITPGADLLIKNVGINPTRTGVIEILKLMGANLSLENSRMFGGEPVADIRVQYSELKGIDIPEELVPLAIDEFPVLFVAAACAEGKTVLTGAKELRVKESDRIQAMADGLQTLGVDASPTEDGIVIQGGTIGGGSVESFDDHRIAMSFTIAGLRASKPIEIQDCANVATSFPGFVELVNSIGMNTRIVEHAS
ncbi:MAG TPA: 3-phosphoshikimate 1-carboxyvinyltransferase [Gammaproteobacteria bacterium]|nr:3-phosphoshikimate 1-carboxyvinyltransferase [Gammaproteobacteria bacterium]